MTLRAVTFDVYSALFNTPAGLARAVLEVLHRRGSADDPSAVARVWRQKQMEYLLVANSLDRERASNRRAIEAAASYALRRLTPPPTHDEMRRLADAWEHLPPWPEAVEVLQQVRRRAQILGTLSNGDEGMLRVLLATLPVTFDRIISTEGGKFKPDPSVYRKALETLGVTAEELLHVAGSPTDAMGATSAGIRTVWVNRMNDTVLDRRFAPAHEAADLWGVLNVLDNP